MPQVCKNSKATCSLLALYFMDALCYSQGTQFALFLLFSLCLLSHSFHSCSQCFPYWQPGLINVFMTFLASTKPLHKPAKINKRKAERGGVKIKGQERKNTEQEPYVMLERPLRTLSIFPSIFGVQACTRRH